MTFSVSDTASFKDIQWNNFENRPQINKSMPFCKEADWYDDVKCCMDGYSIEHLIDAAYEHGNENTPEVQFLEQYPCLNGLELDFFADEIEGMASKTEQKPKPSIPVMECVSKNIFEGLKKVLPEPLLESIKSYLCRQ